MLMEAGEEMEAFGDRKLEQEKEEKGERTE